MQTRNLHLSLIVVGLCLAVVSGCANFRSGTYLGQKVDDPPQLSPYNRSLTQNGPSNGTYRGGSAYRGPFSGFFTPRNVPSQPAQPTPLKGSGPPPYSVERPVPGQPVPDPLEPTDGFGTVLGSPEPSPQATPQLPQTTPSFPQEPPQFGDESLPNLSLPGQSPESEETIRQRPKMDPLEAPTPNRTYSEPDLPDAKTFDPDRQPAELTVNDPGEALVGDTAKFEIVVRNPFDTALENVVVECRFGEGLTFPDFEEEALRQRLGTLGAAETRTIDLALTAESVGTHCVEFTLTADDREAANERRCVVCTEQTVMVEFVGPQTRNVGGRLECVLTLSNMTGREVSGIVATIGHDGALEPNEASAGVTRSPGRLEWDLGLLRVDEQVQIQAEFDCPTASEQTCITAEVSGRDVPTEQREICAVISPQPILDLAVADSRDPVPVGETTTYLVTLTNRGLTPLGDVRIDVELDGELEIIPSTEGLARVSMVSDPASGPRTASYSLSGPISPDDVRTIRIDVRGLTTGTGGLRVTATEMSADRQATANEPTLITTPLLDLPSFEDFLSGQ